MAATGLRTGEAMALDRADLEDGVLIVRASKLGKSRQVPLHVTTTAALARYGCRRDELCPHPAAPSFFLSGAGTRLNHTNASTTFAALLEDAGMRHHLGGVRLAPRPAPQLRGRHAGHLVSSRCRRGAAAPGTVDLHGPCGAIGDLRYLEAAPELMALAAGRLERFLGARP
jgi:integrase/recombinase XerD